MSTTDTEKTSTHRTIGPVTTSTVTAAAVTTVACWILNSNGIDVPGEIQGAITTILVGVAGWVTVPCKRGKRSM